MTLKPVGIEDDGSFVGRAGEWLGRTFVSQEANMLTTRAGFQRFDPTPFVSWLSTFQTGHGWSASGSAGAASNLNDTSDGYLGPQCVSLVTNGPWGVQANRQSLTVNLTDAHLVVAIKVSDWQKAGNITVYAATGVDAWTTHAYRWQITPTPSWSRVGMYDSDEWVLVTLSFSEAVITGTPNRAGITGLRFLVEDRGTGAVTFKLGGIGLVKNPVARFPDGVVSFTFDDSDLTQWTVGVPALSKHSFRGSVYPIIEAIGTGGLTLTHLHAMHRMGWEIGGHATTTATHTTGATGMTDEQFETECDALRGWLLSESFEADTYAWPNGSLNAAKKAIAGRYFIAGRGTVDKTETFPAAQPMNFRSQNVGGLTLAQMKALVDKAVIEGDWVNFMVHGIPVTKVGANDVAAADFTALADYVKSLNVPVLPVREIVRSFPSTI